MAGLSKQDLDILAAYARENNRELYFNFLAQKEGNDGYGLLALGVVRNDNAPGATANHFAQQQATRDGVHYGERDWQSYGVELMKNDLALRESRLEGGRPDLALNLPVLDVQAAHDSAFEKRGINPDAWTPRQLLEAARRHGSEPEAEKVWTMMLDNAAFGLKRAALTTEGLARSYNDSELNASTYFDDMAKARAAHGSTASNVDPDRNRIAGRDFSRSDDGTWTVRTQIERRVWRDMPVTDPTFLDSLNEAREVRLERQQLRTEFHPDDPNQHRPIVQSPFLLSDAGQSLDPRDPSHPRHALHQQCVAGVQLLDARFNKSWDTHSECMAASLTTLAVSNQLERVDHVVLSQKGTQVAAGESVFVVQGELNDPAHRRAYMPTAEAVTTPVEQSFQQLAELDQARGQSHAHAQQQTQNQEMEVRAAMTMRG
jgi:hypothetical protein